MGQRGWPVGGTGLQREERRAFLLVPPESLPTTQKGGQCSKWRGKLTAVDCLVQGKMTPTESTLPDPHQLKEGNTVCHLVVSRLKGVVYYEGNICTFMWCHEPCVQRRTHDTFYLPEGVGPRAGALI